MTEPRKGFIRIAAELDVPGGEFCVTWEGKRCQHLENNFGLKCRANNDEPLAKAYGSLAVKCDACASAGVVLGAKWTGPSRLDKEPPTCTLDGDCDG